LAVAQCGVEDDDAVACRACGFSGHETSILPRGDRLVWARPVLIQCDLPLAPLRTCPAGRRAPGSQGLVRRRVRRPESAGCAAMRATSYAPRGEAPPRVEMPEMWTLELMRERPRPRSDDEITEDTYGIPPSGARGRTVAQEKLGRWVRRGPGSRRENPASPVGSCPVPTS